MARGPEELRPDQPEVTPFNFDNGRLRTQEVYPDEKEDSKFHFMVPEKAIILSTSPHRSDKYGYRVFIYSKEEKISYGRMISSGKTDIYGSKEQAIIEGRKIMEELDAKTEVYSVSFEDGSYVEVPFYINEILFELALNYIEWQKLGDILNRWTLVDDEPDYMVNIKKLPEEGQVAWDKAMEFAQLVVSSPDEFFKEDDAE